MFLYTQLLSVLPLCGLSAIIPVSPTLPKSISTKSTNTSIVSHHKRCWEGGEMLSLSLRSLLCCVSVSPPSMDSHSRLSDPAGQSCVPACPLLPSALSLFGHLGLPSLKNPSKSWHRCSVKRGMSTHPDYRRFVD